ncbi:MAG TPA: hypothetical protein VIU11_23790 [Nakamurella sp.]
MIPDCGADQSQWLALGGSATMCRFQADDEAKSRIYVDLTTLSLTDPTLAGLAYLSKVPMPASSGGANPATGYCSDELHASSSFGGGAAGGGWVAEADPDDVVVSLCVRLGPRHRPRSTPVACVTRPELAPGFRMVVSTAGDVVQWSRPCRTGRQDAGLRQEPADSRPGSLERVT